MTGTVFGRLTVIHRGAAPPDRKREAWWECRCECGNMTIVSGDRLRRGQTKSCKCLANRQPGHIKGERNTEKSRAACRHYYHTTYKFRPTDDARKARKKASYTIWRSAPERHDQLLAYQWRYKDKRKFRHLVRLAILRAKAGMIEYDAGFLESIRESRPSKCDCCGVEFNYGRSLDKRPLPACPSLDRIDPSKGYVAGNVGIICWRCNAIKRDGTLEDHEAIASYMRRHL